MDPPTKYDYYGLITVLFIIFIINLLKYMDILTIISLLLGLLGLIGTLTGLYFTYISFVNPIKRFKTLLNKSKDWERFIISDQSIYIYRHKKYSNNQIIIDKSLPLNDDFKDPWIKFFPDPNNKLWSVGLKSNGIFLMEEFFVSLDGGRYFVPCPRRKLDQGQRVYFYDKIQIQLTNIIGQYWDDKNINNFITNHSLEILIIDPDA
ncbi:MAG: hypothetical protein WC420_00015 [Candidatus Paceibacterota bacterium]|jgi:hypothetical protein